MLFDLNIMWCTHVAALPGQQKAAEEAAKKQQKGCKKAAERLQKAAP